MIFYPPNAIDGQVSPALRPGGLRSKEVWSEDFPDLDRWDFTVGRRWRAEGGKLCAGPRGEHRGFTGDESWADYTVHVNVAEQYRDNGYGVYFRISNEPRINGYAFQYDPGYGRGAFLIHRSSTVVSCGLLSLSAMPRPAMTGTMSPGR